MSNVKIQMSNAVTTTMAPETKEYDLEKRTTSFGENIVRLSKTIGQDAVTRPLISQVVRSATSIGANYAEADCAGSRKEFKYRISLCAREAKETKHWLHMLSAAVNEDTTDGLRLLWKEADELNRIFSTIQKNTRQE